MEDTLLVISSWLMSIVSVDKVQVQPYFVVATFVTAILSLTMCSPVHVNPSKNRSNQSPCDARDLQEPQFFFFIKKKKCCLLRDTLCAVRQLDQKKKKTLVNLRPEDRLFPRTRIPVVTSYKNESDKTRVQTLPT